MSGRRFARRWVFAWLGAFVSAGVAFGQQPGSAPPDPDVIFGQLDVNGDGKLTADEGGPGARQFVQRLLEMARKGPGDSISREELRRLAEQHRRGERGPASGSNDRGGRREPERPAERTAERAAERAPERGAGVARRPSNRSRESRGATPNAKLQERLAGTWRGWVVDGRGENPDSGHLEMELRVEGNRMTGRELGTNRAPQGLGDGTFTIAGDGDAGTLDAVSTSGQHRGRSYPGIFELSDDTLRWCVNNRNGERPDGFETGRGNYFLILRRQ